MLLYKSQGVNAKLSGRILKAAREQQEEVEAEEAEAALQARLGAGAAARLGAGALAAALRRSRGADSDDDDDDDDMDDEQPAAPGRIQRQYVGGSLGSGGDLGGDDDDDAELQARAAAGGGDAGFVGLEQEDEEVSPEDEAALAAFMAPGAASYTQQSLADVVLSKLREKQKEQGLTVLPECVTVVLC
jgi:essential nuclear protein 1